VASGRADAGVLNASVWEKLVEKGDANAKAVKVIATTPPYYDYNWTVRADMPPAMRQKIADAFLSLDAAKPQDKAILELQRASKFIPTKSANYDSIEQAAKSADLIK